MKPPDKSVLALPSGLANVNVDTNWLVQGRVIPGSCAEGETTLYLQARHNSWVKEHYHSGHCPIMPEIGVELAVSVSIPFHPKFRTDSLEGEECKRGWQYVFMAKLLQPADSIAFIAVTGATIILQLPGIQELFGSDSGCGFCTNKETEEYKFLNPSVEVMAAMMEGKGNDKNH